jgi:competence ComEA-like helix-hairpin-helix protein
MNPRERKAMGLGFIIFVFFWVLPNCFEGSAPVLLVWESSWVEEVLTEEAEPEEDAPMRRRPRRSKPNYTKRKQQQQPLALSCPLNPNTADSMTLLQAGFPVPSVKGIMAYRRKGGRFNTPVALKRIYRVESGLLDRLSSCLVFGDSAAMEPKPSQHWFAFDPNQLPEDSLQLLPLPKSSLKGIVAYRSKGGKFRKAEDLKRLYGMNDSLYQALLPHLQLPQLTKPQKPTLNTIVDIQTASAEDLERLPCIGMRLAERIVEYRNRLGGFVRKEQIREVYGIRDSTWACIEPHLVFQSNAVRKLNLNTASEQDLQTHPYLRPIHIKAILAHRKRKGQFASLDELQIISEFNDLDRTFWKIKPYLAL